jgi:hypothetical protein
VHTTGHAFLASMRVSCSQTGSLDAELPPVRKLQIYYTLPENSAVLTSHCCAPKILFVYDMFLSKGPCRTMGEKGR